MFEVLDHAAIVSRPAVRESMLKDRAIQFVQRHNWALRLEDGLEVDEFDAPATTYCLVSQEERHAASVRLRGAQDGSMVERHFPKLWQAFQEQLRDLHEVTRLCIAPKGASVSSHLALGELLIGLCRHCLQGAIPQFFGVIFPSVARTLTRAGWPPRVLGVVEHHGESLLLATWDASHLVLWDLQSELEKRAGRSFGSVELQAA